MLCAAMKRTARPALLTVDIVPRYAATAFAKTGRVAVPALLIAGYAMCAGTAYALQAKPAAVAQMTAAHALCVEMVTVMEMSPAQAVKMTAAHAQATPEVVEEAAGAVEEAKASQPEATP